MNRRGIRAVSPDGNIDDIEFCIHTGLDHLDTGEVCIVPWYIFLRAATNDEKIPGSSFQTPVWNSRWFPIGLPSVWWIELQQYYYCESLFNDLTFLYSSCLLYTSRCV